ncbi:MAG: hypothetical protein AABZ12_05595 [Planctomycetota bacterium]
MVAETRETMARWFDSMNDTFKTALDAGQRVQESWFKSTREAWQQPIEIEKLTTRGERMVREWIPFAEKNIETAAQAYDANFRAGMDMFKTACDVAMKTDDTDVYRRTRQMWDTAFGMFRTNVDVFAKASTRTMENCSQLCECFRADEASTKTSKPAKATA